MKPAMALHNSYRFSGVGDGLIGADSAVDKKASILARDPRLGELDLQIFAQVLDPPARLVNQRERMGLRRISVLVLRRIDYFKPGWGRARRRIQQIDGKITSL